MKKVKRCNTGLESSMEKLLVSLKIKYEKQPRIKGHPDFRIKGKNILIFCDSSFWHGRRPREISGLAFKRNRLFWVKKLTENKSRDLRTNRFLRRSGWSVHRFLDTDIMKNKQKVERRLKRILSPNGARAI